MLTWLGNEVRAQKECVHEKPEADSANHCKVSSDAWPFRFSRAFVPIWV
jgi:hypothetical protein